MRRGLKARMILWVMGLGAVLAACQSAGVTGTPTATEGATVGTEEALATGQAAGLATMHAQETSSAAALATVYAQGTASGPRPTGTPGPEYATPTPAISLPLIADGGAVPPGALMRIGIGYITTSGLSPDGTTLAVGTSTGIYVYRLGDFQRLWRRYTEYPIETISWSPDSRRFITGVGGETEPILWNAATGEKLNTLSDGWYGAAWSPDGSLIAAMLYPRFGPEGPSSSLRLYNGFTGEGIRTFTFEDTAFLSSVVWSPDGNTLAVSDTRCCWVETFGIFLWNVTSHQIRAVLTAQDEDWWPRTVKFSPDGAYLSVNWGGVGTVPVWGVQSGELVVEIAHGASVDGFAWSPDGNRLAIAGNETLSVTDIGTGQSVTYTVADSSVRTTWSGYDAFLAWSPDSAFIALISDEMSTVVSALDGTSVARLNMDSVKDFYVFSNTVPGVMWLPDSQSAIVTTPQDILWWDVRSNQVVGGFRTNTGVNGITWSPDGTALAIGTPMSSQLWDIQTGVLLESPTAVDITPFPSLGAAVFSPDGKLVAESTMSPLCGDGPIGGGCFLDSGVVTIKNVETGEILQQLPYPDRGIGSVAWSPDGSMLAIGFATDKGGRGASGASGLYGKEIIVLDPLTGRQLLDFEGQSGNVWGLAFSPDGRLLASASADGTVIVWLVGG